MYWYVMQDMERPYKGSKTRTSDGAIPDALPSRRGIEPRHIQDPYVTVFNLLVYKRA